MPEPTSLVQEAFATGAEISPIVERVEAALGDVPRAHALIALCSIILLIQHPNLTEEQLYEGVRDVSRFICMWLAGSDDATHGEPADKSKMN